MKRAISYVTCLLLLLHTSYAYDWDIQVVDYEGDVGAHVSLDVDRHGTPHIAYMQYYYKYLKYASLSDSGWSNQVIDASQGSGWYPSLRIGSDDIIHISYQSENSLKYANNTNSIWSVEIVDASYGGTLFGWGTSLALDSNNEPHISYEQRILYPFSTKPYKLKYAYLENDIWNTALLETSKRGGTCTGLAIDDTGEKSILYYNGNSEFSHAYYNGQWNYEYFPQFDKGYCASACFDKKHNLHICYQGPNQSYLGYGFWNGLSWNFEVVDDIPIGSTLSIALDENEYPYISYCDKQNRSLKFAFWNGKSWFTETIDSGAFVGNANSIAIDDSRKVHIAYSDLTNWDLKYAAAIIAEPAILVSVDIKPQSCPNPLNVTSKGVLPVAVLGSEVFDVNEIDIASIEILGVPPIRSSMEDVATPADVNALPEDCLCTTGGLDGYMDLMFKFDTQQIVEAIGPAEDGDYVILTLNGFLLDGTAIEGKDCILILRKGKH